MGCVAFSYSTDGKNDDLSQRRGYASDGTGLCIGFKKNKIKEEEKVFYKI